jgi:hypothetical protein
MNRLQLNLLSNRQGILDLDIQIPHGTLQFRVAQQ